MAYFAKLQDSIVQQIIVVSDTIDDGARMVYSNIRRSMG
jgi:hypothetical protein